MNFFKKEVNNKKILLLLFIMFTIEGLMAQMPTMPTIIPPSPAAQAFMRYSEIPVDYSTGVPNISIPLYTIKGKKLELPISISYHASGIKVNDVASEVGLGWVLNCGGLVSRTVFGIPDERRTAKRTYNNASQLLEAVKEKARIWDSRSGNFQGAMDFEDFFNQTFELEDPMSDRFFYTCPNGISGVFRNDYLDDNNIIILPYRPLKIKKYINSSTYNKIDSIKITDENGIIYTFSSYLNTSTQNYSEWYLSSIISADGTDAIRLQYEPQTANSSIPVESHTLRCASVNLNSNCRNGSDFSLPFPSGSTLSSFNTPVLKKIISSTAIIEFVYQNDRTDFNLLRRLSDITISPINSTAIRSIHFNQKYFGSDPAELRLCLDNVIISTPDVSQSQKYAFLYENQILPPYSYKMKNNSKYNRIPTYSEDFWGYYNGANSKSLIPIDFIANNSDKNAYGGNRDPNLEMSRACMLKEITYPTGGKTVFQFDRHYGYNVYPYKYPNSTNGYYGGFRVARITNKNEKGEVVGVKTYEYNDVVTKQLDGTFFKYNQFYRDLYYVNNDICPQFYSQDLICSDPILPFEVGTGLPIMYPKVTEYNGTETKCTGKTVYEYNTPYSPSDYNNHPEEHQGNEEYEEPRDYHPYHYDKGNYIPELTFKTEYVFNGTTFKPIYQVRNRFKSYYTTKYQTGIKLTRPFQYLNKLVLIGSCPIELPISPLVLCPIESAKTIEEYIKSVVALDTKAYQEASLLENSTTYTYNPLDETKYVTTSTDYTYNESNLGIKEKSTRSSKTDLLKTAYKYPIDFKDQAPYNTMISQNIISPIIEQTETVNTTSLKSIKTNYSYWKSDARNISGQLEIEKDMQNTSSASFTIDKPLQLTVNFHLEMSLGTYKLSISGPSIIEKYYKNETGVCSNYTTQSPLDVIDIKVPGTYIITLSYAASPNCTNDGFYGTAYYDGIFLNDKINTYLTTEVTKRIYPSTVDIKIGNNTYETRLNYNSYDLNGNIINVSKTNDIKEIYIWSYNGNYPVAKIINGDYATIESLLGGSKSIKDFSIKYPTNKEVKDFLSLLITNSLAKNMLVCTYTYDPVYGMTSQTDPNGNTTYYEYDGFGRLIRIKDKDGNILQYNQYNYKQ